MKLEMIEDLANNIEGVKKYYSLASILKMKYRGLALRSFAPMVWLTYVLMALESIKVILRWGNIAYAPKFALYDPFKSRIPKSNF